MLFQRKVTLFGFQEEEEGGSQEEEEEWISKPVYMTHQYVWYQFISGVKHFLDSISSYASVMLYALPAMNLSL